MLSSIRKRIQDEKGFTLIELLVVILIIGILAAIALPSFLSQQEKAQNSDAKSNARNMVSQVEACGAEAGGVYTNCSNTSPEVTASGLPVGTGSEQVGVGGQSANGYTVTATSASGDVFTITKSATGVTRGGPW